MKQFNHKVAVKNFNTINKGQTTIILYKYLLIKYILKALIVGLLQKKAPRNTFSRRATPTMILNIIDLAERELNSIAKNTAAKVKTSKNVIFFGEVTKMFKHKRIKQNRMSIANQKITIKQTSKLASKQFQQYQNQDDTQTGVHFAADKSSQILNDRSLNITNNVPPSYYATQKHTTLNQDKENNSFQTANNKTQSSFKKQSSDFMQQILASLSEIKTQNQYLLERQHELEFMIISDLKTKIEEGFLNMKTEIKNIKKSQSKLKDQKTNFLRQKRFATSKKRFGNNLGVTTTINQAEQMDQSSSQIQEEEQNDQQENQDIVIPQGTSIGLQLEEGAESTFIRKLEQTQVQDHSQDQNIDLRMSLGANLLQIMQMNNPSKNNQQVNKPRRAARGGMRNFNFRCNLEEIDKIIEEETNEIQNNQTDNSYMGLSPHQEKKSCFEEIKDINKSIERESQIRERSQTPNRPTTGQKQPRKGWNVNKQKVESATNVVGQTQNEEMQNDIQEVKRPQTAAQQGIRIKRIAVTKKENEDPILALLRLESQETEEVPQKLNEILEEDKESEMLSNDIQPKNQNNIDMIKQPKTAQNTSHDLPLVSPKGIINQKIISKGKVPVKRGMFKAPPANFIENLLLEEEAPQATRSEQVSPQMKVKSNFEERENRFVKMNNFLSQTEEKPTSRSRSRKIRNNKQRIESLLLASETKDSQNEDDDENPFNHNSTLVKGAPFLAGAPNEADIGTNMMNLFFNRKRDGAHSDTAEFGK